MPTPIAMMLLTGACPGCNQKAGTSRKEVVKDDEKVILIVCNNCGRTIDKEWPTE